MSETKNNRTEKQSPANFLAAEDPLSEEAVAFLLRYREETTLVDFKVDFLPEDEKHWLDITKDVMAFANTEGGYLVFGVRNGTFELIGLNEVAVSVLGDADNIIKKANRFIDPPFTLLRSKVFESQDKKGVVVHVPASLGKTHVVCKDGGFKFPSGQEKVVLREGTTYVRRSAGNVLVKARELDEIISRRIDHYREALMSKIARVVEAPSASEVYVIEPGSASASDKRIVIDDGPNAVLVKGMSFTTPPQTMENEVAAWVALSSRDQNAIPPASALWNWYRQRADIRITQKHRDKIAEFGVTSNVPVFFWIKDADTGSVRSVIEAAMAREPLGTQLERILQVALLLGPRYYEAFVRRHDERISRFAPKHASHSTSGPGALPEVWEENSKSYTRPESENAALEAELTVIASELGGNERPDPYKVWKAHDLDFRLYARREGYPKTKAPQQ